MSKKTKAKQKLTVGAFIAVWVLGGIAKQIKADVKGQALDARTLFRKWSAKKWKKVPKPVRRMLFGAGVTARAAYRVGRHLDRSLRLGARHGIAEGRHRHRERRELAEHPKGSHGRGHVLDRIREERAARWLEHELYAGQVHRHARQRRTDKTAVPPTPPKPAEPAPPSSGPDPLTRQPKKPESSPSSAPAATEQGPAPATPTEREPTPAVASAPAGEPGATGSPAPASNGTANGEPPANGHQPPAPAQGGAPPQLPYPATVSGNGGSHHNNGGDTVATDVESPTIPSVERNYNGAEQQMQQLSEAHNNDARNAGQTAEQQASLAAELQQEAARIHEKASLMDAAGHDRDTVRELRATAESYQARAKDAANAAEAWQTAAQMSGTASAQSAETASLCKTHREGLSRTNSARDAAGSLNGATASLGHYRE